MSEMSYLEKLLDGVEVEWKTLEDITLRTSNIKWREVIRSYRYIDLTSVDIATKKITETTEITKNNAPSRAQKLVDENDVIFATTRPTQQRFCLIDSEYAGEVASTGYCILRAKQDQVLPKWILHWISTSDFKKHVEENQSGSAYPAISDSKVKECLIPIPCPDNPEKSLAIQSEIVRILDKFTALTAELTAELNMRKKQYNYYRDQLLNLEGRENTREMRIGDIYDFQYGTGNTIPKSGGQYPVYGSNGIVGSHDKYNSEDSPVIGHIGAYAGIVNWGQGKHFVTYNGVICRHKSKEVLQKYAYYLLLLQDFGSKSNSASQPFVSYNILNAPIVLVPPLQEQARIVAILDKFDALTNSITEGLPREIELRQKQYEYYRDLLFSFPKPETVSN
ncbi:TPA: restriction endonuclease subunit S [Escherichia coli]|uniref:restriction endonuclease subunit S n=1 Tax=Escherichia coli TaxID=562 RepID=UPI000925AC85|nr:restriction endonuclease subunit S [Escherichia coli]MDZ9719941.1 restriction endonuclease subunit S [Escherichia coli]MEA0256267.1 restriction endonuclease subunit S [Escherichia coli]MEA0332406.1 restriction endonuclease subunit S [Escherichia coli]OJK80428.1 restriction endonuclease subunit S [Escherichia coli]OJL07886.1 restriction endonuclease subunit S [Escherichia coli]